jgi:hypothetical protein
VSYDEPHVHKECSLSHERSGCALYDSLFYGQRRLLLATVIDEQTCGSLFYGQRRLLLAWYAPAWATER